MGILTPYGKQIMEEISINKYKKGFLGLNQKQKKDVANIFISKGKGIAKSLDGL